MNNSYPNRRINEFPNEQQLSHNCGELEYIADVLSKEAMNLVREAGSAEIAKQAIKTAQYARESLPAAAKEELAHDLGYKSTRRMMEQTEIVALPTGSYMHLTIDSDGFWVAWNDKPNYDLQRFNSRQHALTSLREDAESIVLQS
jgi:hypothetical protein